MSFGERPVHSVATICWFSPMSGMASTAMGFRGNALCHSKGENDIPQPMKAKRKNWGLTKQQALTSDNQIRKTQSRSGQSNGGSPRGARTAGRGAKEIN